MHYGKSQRDRKKFLKQASKHVRLKVDVADRADSTAIGMRHHVKQK